MFAVLKAKGWGSSLVAGESGLSMSCASFFYVRCDEEWRLATRTNTAASPRDAAPASSRPPTNLVREVGRFPHPAGVPRWRRARWCLVACRVELTGEGQKHIGDIGAIVFA